MSKQIEEKELPDFLVDFIGDQVAQKAGLFGLTNVDKSDGILKYAYISEQFCLMLQKSMIEQNLSANPEPLSNKSLPNFVQQTVMDTLHLFAKVHKTDNKGLKLYEVYLMDFSKKLMSFLINRQQKKPR